MLHEEDKLKVFDKNSPYLATKKIGKNNPMEEQIKADNEVRQEWNRTVDRAIVSGVSEEDISRIKKNEITEKVRYSDRFIWRQTGSSCKYYKACYCSA